MTGGTNRVWFYMPNGEEVAFCAHAAMAACSILKDGADTIRFLTGIIGDDEKEGDVRLLENIATIQTATRKEQELEQKEKQNLFDEVSLQMSSSFHEQRVNDDTVLKLLEEVGLSYNDVISTAVGSQNTNTKLPSFINSSVARYKTLVPIKKSMLNRATPPKDAVLFRDLCDEIQSTGLYLYTPCSSSFSPPSSSVVSSYECRQFPRFSGYPEDPATGIAAAALAYSLFSRGIIGNYDDGSEEIIGIDIKGNKRIIYEMFQGAAMGKPSTIKIRMDLNQEGIHGTCSGIVEIDSADEISL